MRPIPVLMVAVLLCGCELPYSHTPADVSPFEWKVTEQLTSSTAAILGEIQNLRGDMQALSGATAIDQSPDRKCGLPDCRCGCNEGRPCTCLPAPVSAPASEPSEITPLTEEEFADLQEQLRSGLPIPDPGEARPTPVAARVKQAVYPIRAKERSRQEWTTASAVSLGGNQFLTAAHLTSGMRQPEVQLAFNGKWHPVSFAPVPGQDVARVTLTAADLPGLPSRGGDYLESVYVYGLKSNRLMLGTLTNTDAKMQTISLESHESGIAKGDSGGAVVSPAGELLGTIRGHNPGEKRIVYIEPVPKSPAPQPVASSTQSPASGGRWVTRCYGNHCRTVWQPY